MWGILEIPHLADARRKAYVVLTPDNIQCPPIFQTESEAKAHLEAMQSTHTSHAKIAFDTNQNRC